MTTSEYLCGNRYPGRIIAAGITPSRRLVYAYAIMGRSASSRNRVFRTHGDELYTVPFDATSIKDPALLIYPAILTAGARKIIANGDHSLDIQRGMMEGRSLAQSLCKRTYEPDDPSFTPRISLVLELDAFEFGILRRLPDGSCDRCFWRLPRKPGVLYMIHTYEGDGNPLPSFRGEPRILEAEDGYADILWNSLDRENRISLYVREGDDTVIFNAREAE